MGPGSANACHRAYLVRFEGFTNVTLTTELIAVIWTVIGSFFASNVTPRALKIRTGEKELLRARGKR